MKKTLNNKKSSQKACGKPALQRTLKSAINCSGTALHSGENVSLTLHPAEPDTGIVFRRSDIGGGNARIPAHWSQISDTRLCTTLSDGGNVSVATVEHLMAALAGCHIDNLVVEIQGGEVPAMDGSAAPFVFLIECAGIAEQNVPRRAIRVLKPVSVSHGESFASLAPAPDSLEAFSLNVEIDFDSNAISRQNYLFHVADDAFKSEISRARTFGFLHEVDDLRAAGLALGGSLDNAVVISGDQVLNEGGLRYRDEFVRHKVLDSLGDLYLAGSPLIGHFHGLRSGHSLNRGLLEALFADDDAWCHSEISDDFPSSGPVAVPSQVKEPALAATA
ncbi:MAG: UDP-3-O-acyl-N-acetylglucosamine deacetylase [Alphaproteobacteria bacterium]|nr:UDP-3-O-acyl-N-acetylglucosamine deacetylase [Alphaproteobacteria bacterium]